MERIGSKEAEPDSILMQVYNHFARLTKKIFFSVGAAVGFTTAERHDHIGKSAPKILV
jgi:hypothetical protein